MATQHSPADDIVYNLVSVQYHALKAAQAYDSYVQDAERARKCHELLGQLTGNGGLSSS